MTPRVKAILERAARAIEAAPERFDPLGGTGGVERMADYVVAARTEEEARTGGAGRNRGDRQAVTAAAAAALAARGTPSLLEVHWPVAWFAMLGRQEAGDQDIDGRAPNAAEAVAVLRAIAAGEITDALDPAGTPGAGVQIWEVRTPPVGGQRG